MNKDILGYKKDNIVKDFQSLSSFDGCEPVYRNSPEGLRIIRHTLAHILAQALKRIYKNIQFAIGPATEDGFYYDFLYEKNLSLHDLPTIELEMKKIIKEDYLVYRTNLTKQQAQEMFKNDKLKLEILEDKQDNVSIYTHEEFFDLCAGPHVQSTSIVGLGFKLTNISEIEWHGKRLQRIVGVGFSSTDDLDNYFIDLEERKKNSAENLALKTDLYFSNDYAPGSLFFSSRGAKVVNLLRNYIRKHAYIGYEEIITPYLFKNDLWQVTGHLEKYSENMFILDDYVLKPMNCPGHVLFFKNRLRSYKDLPLRIAEFGSCSRREESGARVVGKRLQCFVQDDGHIFCTVDQIKSEIQKFMNEAVVVYNHLGFNRVKIVLATRPPKRIGADHLWDKAEQLLEEALKSTGLHYEIKEGDGAFYGPKIELHIQDALDNYWQCGTAQVDFFLAERLDATFINDKGEKEHPIMIHRAMLGTIERFMSIWLEHFKGRIPLEFAPTQVVIVPVSNKFIDFASDLQQKLLKNGARVELDSTDNPLGKKIGIWSEMAVPYLIVIGNKEIESGKINIRHYEEQFEISLDELLRKHW